jgi:membrane associated rhomboid family serine protease
MLIPWGSDAPLYHRPIATVVLMVLCVVSFIVFPPGRYADWTLTIGDGLHPVQWLSSLFMHSGWDHIIGNMLFLWVFGIIVEGKLGWWGFMLAFLGIGALESAGTQLLFHPQQPIHMVGASGAIFGLLAMSMIWAPRNEIHCLTFIRFYPMDLDLSILWFAAFYIGLSFLEFGLRGFTLSGAMSHLDGAILGAGLAVTLLKFKLVDCENWDIFAVIEGRQGESKKAAAKRRSMMIRPSNDATRLPGDKPKTKAKRKRKRKKGEARTVTSIEDSSASALRSLRLHLEYGELEAALAVYKTSSSKLSGWQPQESDWRDLIQALLDQDYCGEAAHVMRDYVRKAPEPSPRVCLKLAQVLIHKLARPTQGLGVLQEIPEGALPAKLEPVRQKLIAEAEHLREEGELELRDELW